MKITTDKALIFSSIMIILFTVSMIVLFCLYQAVPDSLVVAFFAAFSCEGGFCALIYKIRKEKNKKEEVTIGDITGFDDAEALDKNEVIPDIQGDCDLVICTED